MSCAFDQIVDYQLNAEDKARLIQAIKDRAIIVFSGKHATGKSLLCDFILTVWGESKENGSLRLSARHEIQRDGNCCPYLTSEWGYRFKYWYCSESSVKCPPGLHELAVQRNNKHGIITLYDVHPPEQSTYPIGSQFFHFEHKVMKLDTNLNQKLQSELQMFI
jgi:hypothetical protein